MDRDLEDKLVICQVTLDKVINKATQYLPNGYVIISDINHAVCIANKIKE